MSPENGYWLLFYPDHRKSPNQLVATLSILRGHRYIPIKMYGSLFTSYCDVKQDVWISTVGDVARNCRDLD